MMSELDTSQQEVLSTEFACTQVASGIPAAEGPVVDRDGRIFLVSSNEGTIVEVLSDGTVRPFVHTEGIPAGLQVDKENRLWCADMKRGILCITPQREIIPVVAEYEGQPIRGCNDCYFDSRGNLYFTAPSGSGREKPFGELFCRYHDGTVKRIDSGFQFSNGLGIDADDSLLIVAETFTKSLWAYPLKDGVPGERFLWAQLPQGEGLGPDGMDFDAEGNLLVAHVGAGTIDVFNPKGELQERLALPFAKISNLHFNGPASSELLLADMTNCARWKGNWRAKGQLQYCHRENIPNAESIALP